MMRQEYINILDEMVINNNIINEYIDGRNLLSYLQVQKVIDYQEKEELYHKGPRESIQHLISIVLKSRSDEDMLHFLNSLQHAKYEVAHCWLKEQLETIGLHSASQGHYNSQRDRFETVRENLKEHYQQDAELTETHWTKFGVIGNLKMDNFYNPNIIINDKYKRLQSELKNIEDLFATDYDRIIITADTGYGKSTFVHEIAHQWVKGEATWTTKFRFLFLFRLAEIKRSDTSSIQCLLEKYLNKEDSVLVNGMQEKLLKNSLFIFDGLDELQHDFCKDVDDIIYGKGTQKTNVIVTSRTCQRLEELENIPRRTLFLELKGYTDDGICAQLKKSVVDAITLTDEMRSVLKVPLFNMLYCITNDKAINKCISVYSTIEKFIGLTFNRYRTTYSTKKPFVPFDFKPYRKMYSNLKENEELQVILMLGQAAQRKFSFIRDTKISRPKVTRKYLAIAIKVGLISPQSSTENFIFALQPVAEYCAAFFWIKTSSLVVGNIYHKSVYFSEPRNGFCDITSMFSCFLSYMNNNYKLALWQKFDKFVPVLDEYESLETRKINGDELIFQSHTETETMVIMRKIRSRTSTNVNPSLHFKGKQFTSRLSIDKSKNSCKSLILSNCSFFIKPEEFFGLHTNIRSLEISSCKFNESDLPVVSAIELQQQNGLILERLVLKNCHEFICATYLDFLMRWCRNLKEFRLVHMKQDDEDYKNVIWLNNLLHNEHLLHSIEIFELDIHFTPNLTVAFDAIKKMINLNELILSLDLRELATFKNDNAFLDAYGRKYSSFVDFILHFNRSNGKVKMDNENLEEFCQLLIYQLENASSKTNADYILAEVFSRVKIYKCEIWYQEMFLSDILLKSIHSCHTLMSIAIYVDLKYTSNGSNFRTFKQNLLSSSFQIESIIQNGSFLVHYFAKNPHKSSKQI